MRSLVILQYGLGSQAEALLGLWHFNEAYWSEWTGTICIRWRWQNRSFPFFQIGHAIEKWQMTRQWRGRRRQQHVCQLPPHRTWEGSRIVWPQGHLTGRSDGQLQLFRSSLEAAALYTCPAGWSWPGIFFAEFIFTFKGQHKHDAASLVQDTSSSPPLRQSHFAAFGAAFGCGSSSFVAMVREGWHQLRFTGCRGAEGK